MKIIHLTSAHSRYDMRIFEKMCHSAALAGHEVSVIVADGRGNECRNGIEIYDVGKPRNRMERAGTIAFKVASAARKMEADIIQLHDPELLTYVFLFGGKPKVIFDAHEDVREQIKRKEYFHPFIRGWISRVYGVIEKVAFKRIDGVVAATGHIASVYETKTSVATVCNYPIIQKFYERDGVKPFKDVHDLIYIGGLSRARGIVELIKAMKYVKSQVKLHICGPFSSQQFQLELTNLIGWKKVDYHGVLDHDKVAKLLSQSDLGLVTLLPKPGYEASLPVKMFEYFAAGVPVIASNFPLWRNIILDDRLGHVVDPGDPKAIAETIDRMISDQNSLDEMRRNGRRITLEKYRWDHQYVKLDKFYEELMDQ